MRRWWRAWAAALILGGWSTGAKADLVITDPKGNRVTVNDDLDLDTSNDPTGFFAQVQACLDRIERHPAKAGKIQELVGSGREHFVRRTRRSRSSTAATDDAGATNGSGSGSLVSWNPTGTGAYSDGVAADPCAALFHELVHAADYDAGTADGTKLDTDGNDATGKVRYAELVATQLENWFRKAEGLPQRKEYGGNPLPEGIVFDCNPDAVCIDHEGGTATIDVEDLYFEIPLDENHVLPGTTIDVGGAAVKLRRLLDGTIQLVMHCGELVAVNLTRIQWKFGGEPIGDPDTFGQQCEPGQTSESMPFLLPDIPGKGG